MIERFFHWFGSGGLTGFLLGRQAVFSLRENWGIAALSVVLAVSLWVYVTDREEAGTITARVPGGISVTCANVPADRAVSPPCGDQSVSVRVRAPENVLDDLTSADFMATADLSDVTADTELVSVVVDPLVSRVDVVEVSPSQIAVSLEDLTARTVPMRTRLIGAPLRGFEIGQITLEPDEAVVSGPQSLVGRVAAVEADVDLTGVRTNFTETLLLHARDDQGGEIKNVTVDPESAVVDVELVQVEFSSPFIVQPVITGPPAPGFVVTGLEVQPPLVTITGPSDVFQNLDSTRGIPTEPISIDGASADVVRPLVLVLPEGARVEQPAITVRVIIARLNPAAATPTNNAP